MSETVKGIDILKERLEGLLKILHSFLTRPRDNPLPDKMRERLEGLTR